MVGNGTLRVLGKGKDLFEVFDETGKNKISFTRTGKTLEVPAGPCVVALNGIRKQVVIKPGEQTALQAGILRVAGIGKDLYEIHDATGTKKLNFKRTNSYRIWALRGFHYFKWSECYKFLRNYSKYSRKSIN